MKKIIRFVLLGLIAFICITAFVKSEMNGRTFWYNAGHQVKQVVVKVGESTKYILSDAKDGYKEKE